MNPEHTFTDIRHVVLDWNGTLLNDFELAVASVNQVLRIHGLSPVSQQEYRRHFQFPISSFYRALGFQLESIPFDDLMRQYLLSFDAGLRECPLHPGVEHFLEHVKRAGCDLSILSATFQPTLTTAVEARGIAVYFQHIKGLGDERAKSKLEEAHRLQARLNLPPRTVLYVGDTLHDVEIAEATGWEIVALTWGHQAEETLSGRVTHCVADLRQLSRMIAGGANGRTQDRPDAPPVR